MTTVLFRRLRQPVVLGYVLAGVIVGPHFPFPLVADRAIVETLSELGVILLMFSLGLEFSLRKLAWVFPRAGITAVIECSIMFWLGLVSGRLFGWTTLESLFAGAIVAISSTTIIAKAFDEIGVRGRLRGLVVGILIVEDLVAVLLIALLTAVASGVGLSAGAVVLTAGRLLLFLAAVVAVGLLTVPRAVRAVRRLDRPETTLVATLGLCFGVALLARQLGYSAALGAFIAGSLVAESGEGKHVGHLVHPVRDVFAAIFFVSVGMLIDPSLVARHWPEVALFTAVVVMGKITFVSMGSFLTGSGIRTAVEAGMSLAQIGEFSFIIAALGASLGATRDFVYPVAVAVSLVTTLGTPWFMRAAGPVAAFVDRKLPGRLQIMASLYASWLEQLRASPRRGRAGAEARRLLRALLVDAVLLAAIVIVGSLELDRAAGLISQLLGIGENLSRWAVAAAALAATLPFGAGLIRNARRLGIAVAGVALPEVQAGRPDLAAAPRRVLVLALEIAALVLAGLPILAVTQPFLPGVPGLPVLVAVLLAVGIAFWRSATGLQGHVRAGAQVIVEALARQARSRGGEQEDALADARDLLPGLGEPVALVVTGQSPAVGRTLAELNLRGVTGATVLAISRTGGAVMVPTASEAIRAGDVLALAGSTEAVEAARSILAPPEDDLMRGGPPPPLQRADRA